MVSWKDIFLREISRHHQINNSLTNCQILPKWYDKLYLKPFYWKQQFNLNPLHYFLFILIWLREVRRVATTLRGLHFKLCTFHLLISVENLDPNSDTEENYLAEPELEYKCLAVLVNTRNILKLFSTFLSHPVIYFHFNKYWPSPQSGDGMSSLKRMHQEEYIERELNHDQSINCLFVCPPHTLHHDSLTFWLLP